MSKLLFIKLLSLTPTLLPLAHANDAVSSVTLKGIEFSKSDTIALRQERLTITPTKIEVDYVFENTSPADESLLISFPMPPIGTGDYDNRNPFSDFTVTVDGKKASFQTECRAYTDTQEVTATLKELGLPACEFKSIASLPKGIQERAVRAKIASDQNVYDELMYTYSISRKHHWKQTFPSGRRVRISHSYRPDLGMNSIGAPSFKWKALQLPEDTRCAVRGQSMRSDEEDQECYARLRAEGMGPGDFSASHLSYIVTSANTWKDGIEDFKLKVSGGKLIFVELDGEQAYDLGELEINKKRFKPKKELTVEFLGKGEPYRIPSLIPLKKEIDGPANCRSQPDGKIIFQIPDRKTALLRERKGLWYRVNYQNQDCWTHRKNLRF